MKQKKLLLRCKDDSVIIMSFVLNNDHDVNRKGTKEEIEAEIAKASSAFSPERLPIKSWEEIEDSDFVHIDRTFRDAWMTNGKKKIEHDMIKAREIHKDRLRYARTKLLEDLDIEYIRADELNDSKKKQEIIAKKQILRDITKHPGIESAQTIEDLKRIVLE